MLLPFDMSSCAQWKQVNHLFKFKWKFTEIKKTRKIFKWNQWIMRCTRTEFWCRQALYHFSMYSIWAAQWQPIFIVQTIEIYFCFAKFIAIGTSMILSFQSETLSAFHTLATWSKGAVNYALQNLMGLTTLKIMHSSWIFLWNACHPRIHQVT